MITPELLKRVPLFAAVDLRELEHIAARAADLILDAALVSRIHCRLEANDETLEVIDLESTNGIYVNGERVMTAHMIPGDRLKVGRVELEVGRTA